MELGHILFSIKNKWWEEKKKVWQYFLKTENWHYIRTTRKRNQSLRKISDEKISRLITGSIWYQEVDDWKLRAINPVFEVYWKICKYIIIW
jgi:hypothetical protein